MHTCISSDRKLLPCFLSATPNLPRTRMPPHGTCTAPAASRGRWSGGSNRRTAPCSRTSQKPVGFLLLECFLIALLADSLYRDEYSLLDLVEGGSYFSVVCWDDDFNFTYCLKTDGVRVEQQAMVPGQSLDCGLEGGWDCNKGHSLTLLCCPVLEWTPSHRSRVRRSGHGCGCGLPNQRHFTRLQLGRIWKPVSGVQQTEQ